MRESGRLPLRSGGASEALPGAAPRRWQRLPNVGGANVPRGGRPGSPAAAAQTRAARAKMQAGSDPRKPLRARKTMTPSSRQQVEALHERRKSTWAEKPPGDPRHGLGQLRAAETDTAEPRPVAGLPGGSEGPSGPPKLKGPVENLVVDSKIHIYGSGSGGGPEAAQGFSNHAGTKDAEVKRLLTPETLQDIFYQWYGKEAGCPVLKPTEVHLNSAPPPGLRGSSEERLAGTGCRSPPSALGQAPDAEGPPAGRRMPVLEPESASSQLQKRRGVRSSSAPGEAKRKRGSSESSDDADTSSKFSRTSLEGSRGGPRKTESGLAKIKCFIQKQVDASRGDLEHQIQSLSERVTRTQCLRKHEEIAIKIVNKISRLDKRIDRLVQKTELARKASVHSRNKEPSSASSSFPGDACGKSGTPSRPPSHRSETLLSPTERSDDILCLGEVSRKPDSRSLKPTVVEISAPRRSDQRSKRPSAVQEEELPVNAERSAKTPSDPKVPNGGVLIDLTEEQRSLSPKGRKAERRAAERRPPAPEGEGPGRTSQTPHQVPEEASRLPPMPKIRLEPEPAGGYQGTLPPQRLELCAGRVENPQGIALQWDVAKAEPRCAPVESFHIFMSVEGSGGGPPTGWVRTNRIKALRLPMACVMSDMPDSSVCHFAMQSRDIYGRYGPFSNVQSVSMG